MKKKAIALAVGALCVAPAAHSQLMFGNDTTGAGHNQLFFTAGPDDEMHGALDAWAAAMPQGVATVRADGDQLHVESCDPGKDADVAVAGNSMHALTLIRARSELVWAAMEQGKLDVDEGFDFAQCVVGALPADEIVKIYTSPDEPPSEFFDAVDSCSAG